jgi:hypothetical protein
MAAHSSNAGREGTPEAARRMVELMRSTDERISLVAADKVIERAFGKPREAIPDDRPRPDLSKLTNAQLKRAQEVFAMLIKVGAFAASADAGDSQ